MFDILASDSYRERVHDDLTLVAVVNAEMLASTKKPVFDREAWDKKNDEIKQRVDSILYAPKPVDQTASKQPEQVTTSNQTQAAPPPLQSVPSQNKQVPQTNQLTQVPISSYRSNGVPSSHTVSKSAQPVPGDTERLLNRVRSSLQNTGYPDRAKLSPELTADLNELKRLVKKSSKQFFAIAHTSALEVSNQVIQHIDRFIVEYINDNDQPDN